MRDAKPAPARFTRNVLVALDGSKAARTALPVAQALAAQLGATVEVLHVTPHPADEAEVRRLLQLDEEALELRIEVGAAAEGILRAIDDPNVGLVVLTTHGREIEPDRLLGSVATAVAARSGRPILLVRPEVAATQPGCGVLTLLVPLDGTPTTTAALRPAARLAQQLGASIDLLHVVQHEQAPPTERGSTTVPYYVDQLHHEWPHWIARVKGLFGCLAVCPADVPVRLHLTKGDIGREIARFAAEHRVDAVVLTRRSHLEHGRASILRAVLEQTPCPALLVAAEADERTVRVDNSARTPAAA
jgi:nucleotide-binding universal stress UspA family protein